MIRYGKLYQQSLGTVCYNWLFATFTVTHHQWHSSVPSWLASCNSRTLSLSARTPGSLWVPSRFLQCLPPYAGCETAGSLSVAMHYVFI